MTTFNGTRPKMRGGACNSCGMPAEASIEGVAMCRKCSQNPAANQIDDNYDPAGLGEANHDARLMNF
jgi:hypothetical protein